MSDDEKLIGKTIVWAQIGGYGVELKFSDGSILDYSSSDGGCSSWEIRDTQEARHGRWIRDEFGSKCSSCGLYAYEDKYGEPWESPYCPICGTKMDEDDE